MYSAKCLRLLAFALLPAVALATAPSTGTHGAAAVIDPPELEIDYPVDDGYMPHGQIEVSGSANNRTWTLFGNSYIWVDIYDWQTSAWWGGGYGTWGEQVWIGTYSWSASPELYSGEDYPTYVEIVVTHYDWDDTIIASDSVNVYLR